MGTTDQPSTATAPTPTWRTHLRVVIGAAVTVAVMGGLTLFTGLPAPGAARRYSQSELDALAGRLNTAGHSGSISYCLSDRDIATVDTWHSRVVLRTASPFPLSAAESDMVDGDSKQLVITACDMP